MTAKKTSKAATSVRTFSSLFNQDKVREIDNRIMLAHNKYNTSVQRAMANAKDFVITH